MNKTELIAAVAEKAELTKKDSEKAVGALIDAVIEAVAAGDKVQVVGFGTFGASRARGENGPQSPHGRGNGHCRFQTAGFKAGKAFKDAVSE